MHMTSKIGLIGLSVLALGSALAQTANPLDTIPEKMPFNIPYGAPISLERADGVLNGALTEAKAKGWNLACAIADSGTNLVSFKRMDDSPVSAIDISQHKAKASAKFRRETKVFESGIQGGNTYLLSLDGLIASRGGIPILDNGKLIGAIGCSGGTGSQDEVAAKAGLAALK
jgi:glc operon protein GlcG